MLRIHGCMFCYINPLFAFLCMRMRFPGPLRACTRARRFRATLLLRIIRMRSQQSGGVSSVADYAQTNEQTVFSQHRLWAVSM